MIAGARLPFTRWIDYEHGDQQGTCMVLFMNMAQILNLQIQACGHAKDGEEEQRGADYGSTIARDRK